MAKNTIILSESELNNVISESVKKVLNEISSDLAYRAYKSANDKRRNAINTPEHGKRRGQMSTFRKYYSDAYNKEHGFDGKTETGTIDTLQFNDTMVNGEPLRVYITTNDINLRSKYFNGSMNIETLIQTPRRQTDFCILSPESAQQVAAWFTKHRNEVYANKTVEACNPEFWCKYYKQPKINKGEFRSTQMY